MTRINRLKVKGDNLLPLIILEYENIPYSVIDDIDSEKGCKKIGAERCKNLNLSKEYLKLFKSNPNEIALVHSESFNRFVGIYYTEVNKETVNMILEIGTFTDFKIEEYNKYKEYANNIKNEANANVKYNRYLSKLCASDEKALNQFADRIITVLNKVHNIFPTNKSYINFPIFKTLFHE